MHEGQCIQLDEPKYFAVVISTEPVILRVYRQEKGFIHEVKGLGRSMSLERAHTVAEQHKRKDLVRKRDCMRCGLEFTSRHPGNRLCDNCNYHYSE